MASDEYEPLRDAYRRKEAQDAPPPWRRIQLYINGLVAVGFGPETDLLLCHSHSGFGVVDCATGRVVARDYEDRELWRNHGEKWEREIAPERVDALFATSTCLYAVGKHAIMKRC